MTDMISSDHPLLPDERACLSALADTLVPASADGTRPSAADIDVAHYVISQGVELTESVRTLLAQLDSSFVSASLEDRVSAVQALQQDLPDVFVSVLQGVYACYYEDQRVLNAIGSAAKPPFPGGSDIAEGDAALLDPVLKLGTSYRDAGT